MTPRTKQQFEKMREESRTEILHAALYLFANKGFHATSMNDIANRAEISKGLIYNYFESKDALLDEIISAIIQENENMKLLFESDEAPDGLSVLTKLLQVMTDMLKKKPDYWKLYNSLFAQPDIMKRYMDKLESLYENGLHAITVLIEKAGSNQPQKDAQVFISAIKGMQLYYIYFGEKVPVEETGAHLLELLFGKGGT